MRRYVPVWCGETGIVCISQVYRRNAALKQRREWEKSSHTCVISSPLNTSRAVIYIALNHMKPKLVIHTLRTHYIQTAVAAAAKKYNALRKHTNICVSECVVVCKPAQTDVSASECIFNVLPISKHTNTHTHTIPGRWSIDARIWRTHTLTNNVIDVDR